MVCFLPARAIGVLALLHNAQCFLVAVSCPQSSHARHRGLFGLQRLRGCAEPTEWEDISGDGGCLKQILHAGTRVQGGMMPRKGCIVQLHYEMSIDGAVLDSSRNPGRGAFEFELGLEPSDGIKGWETALPTMLDGEIARLRCSPAYAFGAAGSPPKIPANATVDCTLELLSWVDKTSKWSQYTGSDVPEEDVYEKYKTDMKDGDQLGLANDLGISDQRPDGKDREVYDLDDVRLTKLRAPNQKISGKFKNYRWTETEKIIDVFVNLPNGTSAKEVDVDIQRDMLSVRIVGSSEGALIQGPLHGLVRTSECWWVVTEERGQTVVHAQLLKLPPHDTLWASVIKGQ